MGNKPVTKHQTIDSPAHLGTNHTTGIEKKISVQLSADDSDTFAAGLNQQDVTKVQHFWRQIRRNNQSEPGRSLLVHVFHDSPEIQEDLFLLGRHGEQEKSERLSEVINQMNTALDYVVENLNRPVELESFLVSLGQRHYDAERLNMFKPQYWDLFAEALIKRTLQHYGKVHGAVKFAWITVVYYTIEKMKQGYYSERRMDFQRRVTAVKPVSPPTFLRTQRPITRSNSARFSAAKNY